MFTQKIKSQQQEGSPEISLESGKWAKQAHGSLVYRSGGLVLLATVCAEKDARAGQSFFPLTVDYREKFYAAGRFPGGYFKRENRPAEHETLMSRLIDRPCRPLFPEGYFCEVQLLITLLSYDPSQAVEGHAITAASAVLMASDIPWDGPIAGVLLGCVDGKFIADPDRETREKSNLELLVAGSKDAIAMIEGSALEYSNEQMLAALEFAHKSIAHKLEVQEKLAKSMQIEKRKPALRLPDKDLIQEVHDLALPKMEKANQTQGKIEREEKVKAVYEETTEHFTAKLQGQVLQETEGKDPKESGLSQADLEQKLSDIKEELHNIEYLVVRSLIFEKGRRADGRKLDEIRDISVEMDVLPGAHGAAVFTRGQTQSLGVVTLGTKMDNQRYDSVEGLKFKNFLLHYNFPPFSTGEVKRMMGPGRREIGHGNLALRALQGVLPDKSKFPYVIRVVSEILESNGSSSMASVCSGSLAMMAAGVPISGAVSGIAMGLMSNEKGDKAVLSDIAGLEDHFGDMDLKVAGTQKGITAFQLDLKVKGIDLKTMAAALKQAEEGRLHILEEMNKVCAQPRAGIPEGAPRIENMQIDPSRIGEMIGPGGRIIRDIIERSGAEVNVEDDGTVTIASTSLDANEQAKKMIDNIFRELEEGESYEGVVKRIVEFGAFIELCPGKEGLLHISKMSNERVASVSDLYKEGDKVPVVVMGIDRAGRIDLHHRDYSFSASRENDRGNGRGDDRGYERGEGQERSQRGRSERGEGPPPRRALGGGDRGGRGDAGPSERRGRRGEPPSGP